MLMGQKYRVHRNVIIAQVRRECGVDLNATETAAEIVQAVHVLDRIKAVGLGGVDSPQDAEPGAAADGGA